MGIVVSNVFLSMSHKMDHILTALTDKIRLYFDIITITRPDCRRRKNMKGRTEIFFQRYTLHDTNGGPVGLRNSVCIRVNELY